MFLYVNYFYFRLDYFLVSSLLLSDILDIEIYFIVVSDYVFVFLILMYKNNITLSKNWRFNILLFKDEDFIKYFKKEWILYLDFSDIFGILVFVLWEVGKVVMRGKIIFFLLYKKKEENKNI